MPPKEAKVWSIPHASVLLLGLETERLGRGLIERFLFSFRDLEGYAPI